jgi:hypothetical protein
MKRQGRHMHLPPHSSHKKGDWRVKAKCQLWRSRRTITTRDGDQRKGLDSCRSYPSAGIHPSCHVRTAPSWQEHSSRLQHWSVQPCVRPVCAVHMTAGHNALRGSGPGQKPAFDNALARVGCPDRRIDRLCITCFCPPNLVWGNYCQA